MRAAEEATPLNQITERGFDDELSAGRADTVGAAFDHLIGSWTQAEADELDAALEAFETIDEAAWR